MNKKSKPCDFEMMLCRLVWLLKRRGITDQTIKDIVEKAESLIARRGKSSPLKGKL